MRFLVAACALSLIAGCGPAAGPSAQNGVACADGGNRLAVTGLCQSEASVLLTPNPEVRTPELEGCTWSIKEVMLPVDEVLLYSAATCGDRDTTLTFAGGAHSAEIAYESSAAYGQEAAGRALVHLFGVDPDPQGALKAVIAEAPAGDSCEVQPAQREGLPADALIIAPNARARARLPAGQPVVACGPMGVDETKQSYWRVRQGFAWYFDLGAQDPDVDAGNMTIVVKGADGAWQVKS